MIVKEGEMRNKYLFLLEIFFIILFNFNFISASYVADIYFNIPNSVYIINERIELKGLVFLTNLSGTNVSNLLANANVNLSIRNSSGGYVNSYNFTTDANGTFYSKSNYYTSATEINASSIPGNYAIRAQYKDPDNISWFSEVGITVINQTLDLLRVSSQKAVYNPSESLKVEAEAIKIIGDSILYVSNVSVNGSLRNSSKGVLQTFSCTTGQNGKCSVYLTAPSSYGNYILELENFKTYNSFSVIPFSYNLYMKDELGKSLKNVFALGEQARVEVKVSNASTTDEYTFSGYIANSSGSVKTLINLTILNNNNSFTNSFLVTINAINFAYGAYGVYVNVTKTGDGSISSLTSFKVEDWTLAVNKKTTNSSFEYDYSAFANKTLKFEALPTYRSNGSVITNLTSGFIINLKDNLNNIVASTNATWNASCGNSGCYEFSFNSPLNPGQYALQIILSYSGSIQTISRIINVINGVMSAQSTDKDGNIKELFGTNEYTYITLSAYNLTSAFNLSDAEVFIISYMNGSEFSYTNLSTFEQVNSSNSAYEWAWNSTLQRIKLDVPKIGGVYNIYLFGNNRTLGTATKFIVNPYDSCAVAKNTPGTVSSGYYYVWQFKTTDTIYFELKLTQANNPLGKASATNVSGNGSSTYGMGSACNVDTSIKQVINNATIAVSEVKNLESGIIQSINSTESTCQSSDNSGGYSCTVKPLSKWEGGQNIVKFNIAGQDGTTTIAYSRFEARAFYLYGWSNVWQSNPTSNITLSLRLYEAGNSWWSNSGGSGGLSGTITLKKIEYQGRDGEWIWPPVDSGYNSSRVNSSSITTGTSSLTLPAAYAANGTWKTGYYRAVLAATTSSGDTDYGYAWFGVKLWDVYGSPVECTNNSCNYKSYFNSKENITLYIKIAKAGSYDSGGQNIWGNTSISVKKIQDCRKWPCRDLNSTQYTANTIYVNSSSPWYWNSNSTNSNYFIYINNTAASWGTGYYNVVLNINGTDTGYAWFNTIAFYVETNPVNSSGSYKYSIRGNVPMYFNVSTTKSLKWWNSWWNGSTYINTRYNSSDYVNVTFDDATLRTWDYQTWQSKEYNYPEDINVTPRSINGTGTVNITFNNGTWTNGYYWGEITFRSSENETSSGYLWFNVQPFRVQINTVGNTYNMDIDQCVNSTLYIYDSDWNMNTLLAGNFSITSIYEDIWSGYGATRTIFTNYTNVSFNATRNLSLCPNNVSWSSGSWGGYHYLNIVVKDNVNNDSQSGWLSFRTLPFQVSWSGTGGNKLTTEIINFTASLIKPSTGANTTGNLTKLYQWRYDSGMSTMEEYVFRVGNCFSNVSGNCFVNGTQNVTIYPPSGGWKIGYNYVQSEWVKDNDASATVQDYYGIYFEGRSVYNGYFENYDANGNWKYYFSLDENITIKLTVRDNNYSAAGSVTISNVQYAYSENCWDENCRSYTNAVFSPATTNAQGVAFLNLSVPSGRWSRGYYAIKATVGGASITGGNVRVKNMTGPNITVISPVNNGTYGNSINFNATTTKDAQCSISLINYNNFNNWYCSGWNSTNSTNSSSFREACNTTKYNYNGSSYQSLYISSNYYSSYDGSNYSYYSGSTGFTTGGMVHYYNVNTTNLTDQAYGMAVWCWDDDYNSISEKISFRVNKTT